MSNPEIRFVTSAGVDRQKWDRCISQSPFAIVYAFSWYLDRICPHWDALIGGDYQYVMPLVNRRKYGFRYIYQPFFTQQLGVFSDQQVVPEIVDQFLEAIPKPFRLVDMNLNLGNAVQSANFAFGHYTTFHLSLRPEIAEIRSAYNSNTRRNIQKAIQNKVSVSQFSDVQLFIEFTRKNLKEKSPEVKLVHYSALGEVIRYALSNNSGEIYVARNPEGKLLAAVFFPRTKTICIYLAASSSEEGIGKSAMFLLIDTFIQNNAGNNLVLDFEGSNIQGVARFYAGFGALPQTYYSVHQNRLPAFLRVFKK